MYTESRTPIRLGVNKTPTSFFARNPRGSPLESLDAVRPSRFGEEPKLLLFHFPAKINQRQRSNTHVREIYFQYFSFEQFTQSSVALRLPGSFSGCRPTVVYSQTDSGDSRVQMRERNFNTITKRN